MRRPRWVSRAVLLLAAPALVLLGSCIALAPDSPAPASRPNIILVMSDDQGWGDAGYMGHPALKTPSLDAMAANGLCFSRWYSASPVCSPTRGSCLTGRSPFRFGVRGANVGHLPPAERTLAESLKPLGYTTGHFGKWHLGTLTVSVPDSNRGGRQNRHYSPPWEHGFDVCFSTEAKVPTYDPMRDPENGGSYGTSYWTGPEEKAESNLFGDDSRVIMDRVIPFIEGATRKRKPFFAVIWFHSPHEPVVAGEQHRALYPDESGEELAYYACLTAMDEQIGRLRDHLKDLGVADDTMLWFCSDNGPKQGAAPGSTGGLRGRKATLYEGGIRVPGLLEWPKRITSPRVVDTPCFTSDYVPTILELVGVEKDPGIRLDGTSLVPLIDGEARALERTAPMAFQSMRMAALISGRHKLIEIAPLDERHGKGRFPPEYELYDVVADPAESNDLSAELPRVTRSLRESLAAWQRSWREKGGGK